MKSYYKELKTTVLDEYVYHIIVGRNVLERLGDFLRSAYFNSKLAIVGKGVHDNFPSLTQELQRVFEEVIVIEDGEKSKELETALYIIEKLWEMKASRWDAIACVAGGSLCDAVGFAASIYMRGVPFVQIPTTLLAMIDSSLGGKTAVNYKGTKNIIGSFYHPSIVVNDLRFIETLPERVYLSSLAEALKYGFTLNEDYLSFLVNKKEGIISKRDDEVMELILQASKLKLDVVRKDPRERKGIREVLNYGHTVGHALESGSNYELLHGEAVALGMIVETKYYDKINGTELDNIVSKVISDYEILKFVNLNSVCKIEKETYVSYILRDKKRIENRIRVPVLLGIGKWELRELPVTSFAKETYSILKSEICKD